MTLVQLHSLVTNLTAYFCRSRFLVHQVTGDKIDNHKPPSPNEKRRLYRAFYRFELVRHLFFRTPLDTIDPMDQARIFFTSFNLLGVLWQLTDDV